MAGIGLGVSMFVGLALYGLAFWYGGRLLRSETVTFEDFLISFFSIVFCSTGATEVGGAVVSR